MVICYTLKIGQSNKLFVNGFPLGAPFVLRKGLLSGQYAWWVQIPIKIVYAGFKPPDEKDLTLQLLVVRVSTLNNLMGVGISNVIVTQGTGNQLLQNG
jgi:hypothetical protein